MASELSREQLLDTVEQTDPQVQSDSLQRSCARATIKHHDAALREQQTIDQLCIKAQANELGRLRQQLEQSQQLVTDGHEAIGHWQGEYEQVRQRVEGKLQCGHSAQWYAVDDDANDDCLGCRTMHLQQQLAAAQARILELEQALRLHLAVAADDPILLTPIEQQVVEAHQLIKSLKLHQDHGKNWPT